MATASNAIRKVLIVVKSQRFDRMVGLNRVVFQTRSITEESKWLQNQAVTEALDHNEAIIEMRKQNQKRLNLI